MPRPADRDRDREEVGKVGQKVDAATFRRSAATTRPKQIDLQRADFKRLGVLGDWENPYRTMDFGNEADMIRALAKIMRTGHVVRGLKPVYWCFDCGSALAEAEIEYQDKQSPAIDVAFDALEPKALRREVRRDALATATSSPCRSGRRRRGRCRRTWR